MNIQIDKFQQAITRIKNMDKRDIRKGLATPQDIGRISIFHTGLAALDAGIKMMKDGGTEQAEEVLYEAAAYFIKCGETPENK